MSGSTTREAGQRDQRRQRRLLPIVWISSLFAAVLVILTINGTLASWMSAIVDNSDNQAGSAAPVVLREVLLDSAGDPTATTCESMDDTDNSSTCTTINKYGNHGATKLDFEPGSTTTTKIRLSNVGTSNASALTLQAGACAATTSDGSALSGGTPSLCGELEVAVECVGDATLTLSATSLTNFTTGSAVAFSRGLHPGQTTTCTFTVQMPADASYQVGGQKVTQPITWTLTA